MDALDESWVERKLLTATNTQDSVQSLSMWALHHKTQHEKIVAIWFKVLKMAKLDLRLTLFNLCNEVVQTCRKKHAIVYKDAFKEVLRDAALLVRDGKIRPNIERIFKIWADRGVYDAEFVDELLALLNNTKVKSALSTRLLADFTPSKLMDQIVSCSQLEDAVEEQRRHLDSIEIDLADVENFKQQLKDRSQGVEYAEELAEICRQAKTFVTNLETEMKERTTLIELLEQSELYYDAQAGEANVVAMAYNSFGNRVMTVWKKFEDRRAILKSTIASPEDDPIDSEPRLSPEDDKADNASRDGMDAESDDSNAPLPYIGMTYIDEPLNDEDIFLFNSDNKQDHRQPHEPLTLEDREIARRRSMSERRISVSDRRQSGESDHRQSSGSDHRLSGSSDRRQSGGSDRRQSGGSDRRYSLTENSPSPVKEMSPPMMIATRRPSLTPSVQQMALTSPVLPAPREAAGVSPSVPGGESFIASSLSFLPRNIASIGSLPPTDLFPPPVGAAGGATPTRDEEGGATPVLDELEDDDIPYGTTYTSPLVLSDDGKSGVTTQKPAYEQIQRHLNFTGSTSQIVTLQSDIACSTYPFLQSGDMGVNYQLAGENGLRSSIVSVSGANQIAFDGTFGPVTTTVIRTDFIDGFSPGVEQFHPSSDFFQTKQDFSTPPPPLPMYQVKEDGFQSPTELYNVTTSSSRDVYSIDAFHPVDQSAQPPTQPAAPTYYPVIVETYQIPTFAEPPKTSFPPTQTAPSFMHPPGAVFNPNIPPPGIAPSNVALPPGMPPSMPPISQPVHLSFSVPPMGSGGLALPPPVLRSPPPIMQLTAPPKLLDPSRSIFGPPHPTSSQPSFMPRLSNSFPSGRRAAFSNVSRHDFSSRNINSEHRRRMHDDGRGAIIPTIGGNGDSRGQFRQRSPSVTGSAVIRIKELIEPAGVLSGSQNVISSGPAQTTMKRKSLESVTEEQRNSEDSEVVPAKQPSNIEHAGLSGLPGKIVNEDDDSDDLDDSAFEGDRIDAPLQIPCIHPSVRRSQYHGGAGRRVIDRSQAIPSLLWPNNRPSYRQHRPFVPRGSSFESRVPRQSYRF